MLPGEVKKQWKQWINQVPIIHFNNYKYDLNMMKKGLALRKGLALTKVVIPVKMYLLRRRRTTICFLPPLSLSL